MQSQSLLDGQALVTDQRYTTHGELLSQSMPYSQSDIGSYLIPPAGQAANQFDYDALDRLVSASASGGDNGLGDYSLEMAYDSGSGNLRQKGELLYLYGDSGHRHAVTAASDGWRYEYDSNGNLVRKVSQPWCH